jgi:hypothetical protein
MKKLSQKEICFLLLLNNSGTYLPAHFFVGEKTVKLSDNSKHHVYLSYKAPTRLSELYDELIPWISRREVVGLSGSRYYEYSLNNGDKDKFAKYSHLL